MDRMVWVIEMSHIYDINGASTHAIYGVYATEDSAIKKAEEYIETKYGQAHLFNDFFEHYDPVKQVIHIAEVRPFVVQD